MSNNNQQKYFLELKELIKNAYTPYSHFNVAAIIETDKGIFSGVNVENSVLPLTLCAERNAIFSAVTKGASKVNNLYLLTSDKKGKSNMCGSCRQVLSEWIVPNGKIYVFDHKGNATEFSMQDLLPHSFGVKDLKTK